MILCPYCQFQNMEGVLFCDDCGTPLIGNDVVTIKSGSTYKLSSAEKPALQKANIPVSGGTTMLKETTVLVLLIDNQQRIKLDQQAETVLGRTDSRTQTYPDVDLGPFGATEKGVSRTHAAIRRSDDWVALVDLGSANGTYLNGKQVMPKQPHILHDGDELRFGKLTARIYFT